MAKLYYSQQRRQFVVAEYNPGTKRVEVIDSDADLDALGTRQGFLSDEDDEEDDEQLLKDFGVLLKD